ncbi:DNA polymerase Y family protein [Lachnoclostridium sp. Marseille-P6806]|uniref:DNA polymerase Y family protein n=1 Tax=Lachnoclostridium sp. Marseille-P6806 TaxID=2364793 RepID=UPI00102F69F9|nr:DNA polymerase IV [Lachnoclostridium sp. Marseille-P6806]
MGVQKQRLIFHVDVNSAFLSWTAVRRLEENPEAVDLRTIPSVIGGDRATRHGIVTAKSIPAKRYGIETAEPVAQALRKCPQLVVAQGDFATYRRFSHALMDILRRWSPVVEQASIDEAYLDMTAADLSAFGEVKEAEEEAACRAADAIRREVREELRFTVNVGVSRNKLLAKMASDFTKPDRTHTLFPEEIPAKLWPLPIGSLYGCGKKTAARLRDVGIITIGDAAAAPPAMLEALFGEKWGQYIRRAANGISTGPVSDVREEAKSYSNETTTAVDVTAENVETLAVPLLRKLCGKVASRLRKDGVRAGTIGVMAKTSDFRNRSMQQTVEDPLDREEEIFRTAETLLRRLLLGENGHPGLLGEGGVRLIGVSVSHLTGDSFRQMTLTDFAVSQREAEHRARERKLSEMEDSIQLKYGDGALRRGV